jgi:hypothetical protein
LWTLLSGRGGVHSTDKKFTWLARIAKIRSMFRRRSGAVIDEDYVQEHIWTGGNVAPLEAPGRLVNSRPAISLGVVASCSIQDHSSGGTIFSPDGIAYASAKKTSSARCAYRPVVCSMG